ncbi:MAG: hypothetical protein IJ779_06575 [Ruminococcus sp.]|nr:hypothetical protein [Ruminococcus sp.]
MRKLCLLSLALAVGLCGCGRRTYEDFSFPEQEMSSLIKVGDTFSARDYSNTVPKTEETEETYSSADGLCTVEKKADYIEVWLDTERDGHYNAGRAYGEALAKALPDYVKNTEDLVIPLLAPVGNDDNGFSAVTEEYIKTLSEEQRQELQGFANSFGSFEGMVCDGGISFEEAAAVSMMADVVGHWMRGNSISVSGDTSATGETVSVTVMNCLGDFNRQLSELNTVLHLSGGEKTVTMIGIAGAFASETAVNSDGLSAAVHQYSIGDIVRDEGESSVVYSVREALERCSSAEEAAEFILGKGEFTDGNILLTDSTQSVCVEADGDRKNIRYGDSELIEQAVRSHPDCMCVVNAPVCKGADGEDMSRLSNITTWRKTERLLGECGKISADDLKAIVTCDKIGTEIFGIGIRSMLNRDIIIFDSADRSIQAVFTGKDGTEEEPEFILIGGFDGKQ